MKDILSIDALALGVLQTNCFVIHPVGERTCWVFDPAEETDTLLRHIEGERLDVERIVLTHGHADHIAGVAAVKKAFPDAVITVPAGDEAMLADPMANMSGLFGASITAPPADQLVAAGDELTMGPIAWTVLDTAGHTPGGVSYYCPAAEVVVAGDALFARSIGRTDIPGGDAARLIAAIRENLLTLPEETVVLPGHGPVTTVGAEKSGNPFL